MPYPNQHAARVGDKSQFDMGSLKTNQAKSKTTGKAHSVLVGRKKGKAKTATYGYRYPAPPWTEAEARAHAKRHGAKVFEPAANVRRAASKAAPIDADAFALSSDRAYEFAATAEVETVENVPRRKFAVDMLQIGKTYRHPIDKWRLKVTPELANKIVDEFSRMAENGVDVPVLAKHSFDERPELSDVLGYLRGVSIDEDRGWLRGESEFIGKDSIKIAEKVNRVSAGMLQKMKDGQARTYSPALHHLAVTPFPVVDDQSDFVPLAASRGSAAELAPVLTLSAAREENKMNDELLGQIRALLGNDELAEDGVGGALEAHFKKTAEQIKAAEASKKSLEAAQAKIKALEAKVMKLAENDETPDELDPDIADELAESASEGIETLAASGLITPAVAKKLDAILVGEPGDRHTYALSRRVSGRSRSLARDIIDALKENNPRELREKTRAQRMALDRENPDDDEPGNKYDPKVQAEMSAMAYGPDKK
jgi:hypothetical protein